MSRPHITNQHSGNLILHLNNADSFDLKANPFHNNVGSLPIN